VVGHNVGTFLQRARSGRGCSARASAGDRAVAVTADWHRCCRLLGSSPHYRRRRSAPAARGRRCRKATVVRDYLFRRQTQVAKYFNRTPWRVSVTGGLHSPLVAVAPALPTTGLHVRLLRFIPASRRLARSNIRLARNSKTPDAQSAIATIRNGGRSNAAKAGDRRFAGCDGLRVFHCLVVACSPDGEPKVTSPSLGPQGTYRNEDRQNEHGHRLPKDNL
jgi:hypothetical protein